jgi:hypothetical protein
MTTEIDEETIGEIRRAYKRRGSDSTAWAIAARFGLTTEEVVELCDQRRRALARREAKAAEKIARRTAAERRAAAEEKRAAEIRRLWSAGTTGRALAAKFGMAPSKVSGIVGDLPRPVRYAGPESAPRLPPLPRPTVPLLPPEPADRLVREPTVRGSQHGRALLDEAKVIEMRRLRSQGWSTGRLATRYGVARNTACYAISGRTWGHIEAEPETKGGTT